jgi:MOSC domain-containing protein YiiM
LNAARGKIEEILVYPRRRQPAEERDEVFAVASVGLEGDHRRSPSRAVTLLSVEAWAETMAQMGADLPPRARRANLVVSGIDLPGLIGRRIRIGGAEVEVRGETEPCDLMELQAQGLREALAPAMRGGVFGRVERTGRIQRGDPVSVLDPSS